MSDLELELKKGRGGKGREALDQATDNKRAAGVGVRGEPEGGGGQTGGEPQGASQRTRGPGGWGGHWAVGLRRAEWGSRSGRTGGAVGFKHK